MPNRFTPINPGSDLSAIVNQINQNFAKLDGEAVTKVINGPNSTNRLIQGRLPGDLGYGTILYDALGNVSIYLATDADGNPVLKIAKEGKDATTGGNEDLVFNSSQNVLKVVATDTTTIPGFTIAPAVNTGFRTATVTSPVPFAAVLAFMVDVSGNRSPVPGFRVFNGFYAYGAGTSNAMPLNQWVTYNSTSTGVDFTNNVTVPDTSVGMTVSAVNIKYYLLQETVT
jgi:hypothetical protein